MKIRNLIITLSSLLLAGSMYAAELGNFSAGSDGWTYSPGGEYPGSQGSLTTTTEGDTSALKLEGNFTSGGKYVAAFKKPAPPVTANAITLKVKSNGLKYILVRLRGDDNQIQQHRINLADSSDWQELTIAKFASGQHWGGKNDGTFYQPLIEIGILIEKQAIREGNSASLLVASVDATQ